MVDCYFFILYLTESDERSESQLKGYERSLTDPIYEGFSRFSTCLYQHTSVFPLLLYVCNVYAHVLISSFWTFYLCFTDWLFKCQMF